jgi:2-polyprenyl-6-methoxyphenol hydroxylase-like FAD-dependent oxidoreductase
VLVRDLVSNRVEPLDYGYLVIADGKNALQQDRPAPTGDLGVQAHFVDVRDDSQAISLFSLPRHYCGLAPVEGGMWNVAYSVPADRIRAVRDFDELWAEMLAQNHGLRQRMHAATRIDDWIAAPLPRFGVRREWPNRVIPIGNAAAALEPIGGEGMGLAMHSAELALEAIEIAAQQGQPVNVAELMRKYRHLWLRRSITCRLGAMLASSPSVSRGVVALMGADSRLSDALLTLTGKRLSCR